VDLGICELETKQFGRHLFCDFCPRNVWSHAGFDLPQELLDPESSFHCRFRSQGVWDKQEIDHSTATWTDIFNLFVLVVACKRGLEACSVARVGSWDHTLGFRLSHFHMPAAWFEGNFPVGLALRTGLKGAPLLRPKRIPKTETR